MENQILNKKTVRKNQQRSRRRLKKAYLKCTEILMSGNAHSVWNGVSHSLIANYGIYTLVFTTNTLSPAQSQTFYRNNVVVDIPLV